MKITQTLLDELTLKAKANPRLRQNLDLRTTPEDQSQRMLNAVEPGSEIPVHRHRFSTETVAVLRGRVLQCLYDDKGRLTDSFEAGAGMDTIGFSVPVGAWHHLKSLESGTVILEAKDGAWQPLDNEDILVPETGA